MSEPFDVEAAEALPDDFLRLAQMLREAKDDLDGTLGFIGFRASAKVWQQRAKKAEAEVERLRAALDSDKAGMYAAGLTLEAEVERLKVERDEAWAAANSAEAEVLKLHHETIECRDRYDVAVCAADGADWPCPTVRALEGEP